ncbi:MAG: hypothetical protein K2M34_03180 [Alphaproteobacteria bacterium]|nr:hypothetical protein [Alphaproteobacteria bacterium]
MADKKNKDIVIDGVRYKLSPADWELQQQILSRATVVHDDKAPQVKSAGTSEKLNDAVVQRLVGHTNVVYYNCETNMWNTNKYNGYTIDGQVENAEHVKEFKTAMEREPKFSQQYEFAASITMTIDSVSFKGYGNPISNPKYNQKGRAVVGNIIVKNKLTGKYELYCKSWVGDGNYSYPECAVSSVADWFVRSGAYFSTFRAALFAAHVR